LIFLISFFKSPLPPFDKGETNCTCERGRTLANLIRGDKNSAFDKRGMQVNKKKFMGNQGKGIFYE